MNHEDILSGKAGLAGIQAALNGPSSRRLLRSTAESMMHQGFRAGPFRLTRAKFKPGRKLSAYYTFPALDPSHQLSHSVYLAATWRKDPGGTNHDNGRDQLQEEAYRLGLLRIQRELWRNIRDQGLELEVWPFDPQYRQLIRLGDPSYVAGMFASFGIAHDPKKLPLIAPIRYRPGERHVLRYEIFSPTANSGQGQQLYAKLYSNAQDTTRAFELANRVADWLAANEQGVQGNRPRAMSEEDGVVLYPHVSGVPLSRQLHRSQRWLAAQLRLIGKSLAILHSGPEALQSGLKQNTFVNEARVVRRASEHIQVLLPGTYERILEVLEKAEERYSALPQEEPGFTHSDFKSDHLFCSRQGITLIDFDTCTLTDPALDIGKFLADLEWWYTIKGIPGLQEAGLELLKGYAGEGKLDPIVGARLDRAGLFKALILVKIIVRRVPLYEKGWAAVTRRMIDRAAQGLNGTLKV